MRVSSKMRFETRLRASKMKIAIPKSRSAIAETRAVRGSASCPKLSRFRSQMVVDKSVLSLPEIVGFAITPHQMGVQRPCLICGRQPSDPHHLRFAQPRALGRKVSDEFIVPLCGLTTVKCIGAVTKWVGGHRRV